MMARAVKSVLRSCCGPLSLTKTTSSCFAACCSFFWPLLPFSACRCHFWRQWRRHRRISPVWLLLVARWSSLRRWFYYSSRVRPRPSPGRAMKREPAKRYGGAWLAVTTATKTTRWEVPCAVALGIPPSLPLSHRGSNFRRSKRRIAQRSHPHRVIQQAHHRWMRMRSDEFLLRLTMVGGVRLARCGANDHHHRHHPHSRDHSDCGWRIALLFPADCSQGIEHRCPYGLARAVSAVDDDYDVARAMLVLFLLPRGTWTQHRPASRGRCTLQKHPFPPIRRP
mmetsp:Transcript_2569/g.6977  ORF Transcript_2569/g.6977 Transcript_2569/m.6977 type:complete len:281 (-) Transcript_2569:469-1311(-)